jgi:hypothetical protein
MAAALPDSGEFGELETVVEVLGYLIACARAEGADELAWVAAAVLAADLSRAERRSAATTLRKLGYVQVADKLRTFKKLTICKFSVDADFAA